MGKREKKRLKHKSERVPGACLYCNSNEDNELKYGKLIYNEKKKIRVHHYCLLFASGLCQRGQENDDKGIEGFLIPDILEEYKRGARLRCVYCKQSRATVGCVIKSCRSMYHFGCGVENRALFLFYDNFISYCQVHRPQQDEPELPSESPTSTCPICLESVEAKVSDDTLRTPCCTNSWFHRICVQRQALSAGYFFRCGICNNKEDFQREMKQFGIYIPEQDAAWELEDNAYQELYQRHNQCDIEPCICPKGRKYHPSRGQWEVVLCDTCGSRGCHLTCGGLANQWDDWVCDQCEEVVDKINKSRWGQQGAKPKKSSKKTSTKSTTPKEKRKEKRKEKLMGKSPRTPLPSHIPVKKKAAPSTCPSLSPPSPSDSMAQLSIHLPSVSASPNDGLYLTDSNQCSSTPCSNQKSSGSSKKKGQCYTPCKDQSNSCRKHLALSSNCSPPYGSPPHFCCTSQDSFAHSHESSIPHLSVEMNVKNPQKHPQHKGHHVCHKYGSSVSQPAVKTTSRMSMRGPATGQLAFKRAQIQIHRHSLSGVHLCARHRQQMQHSNMASWNGTNSVGSASSTSSHNSSSSSSDDIEFGTVHLTPDGKVTSSSIKNLDMTTSKAAVVQLKPLSNIMPVLCQRVSLGSNDSESQAILGSALAKQANLGATAKPFKHTCSKRKLENKEPSAPRKKFKFGKTPPPKKVENKSPNPRKMLKNVPSPQKTAKSSTKNQNVSTPKKMDKSAKESLSVKKKASTTPQKSPKKSTTPKKAREFISKHKGKNSPKKAGSIDKSQKKGNRPLEIQKKSTALPSPKKKLKLGKGPENKTGSAVTASSSPAKTVIKKEVASPRKMAVKTSSLFSCKPKVRKSSSPRKTSPVQIISVSSLCHKKPSPKPAAPLETAQKEESAQKVVAKKPAFKKVPAKVKKQCEMSKQATLDKFLQPLANKVASADSDLNQEPNRAVTGSDEMGTGNNQTDDGGMSGKRTSEETRRATPKKQKTDDTWAMSISSSPESLEKESKEDETGAGGQKNIGNSVQSSSSGILSDLLLQSPVDLHKEIKSVTTANPEEQGNSSGILSDLLSQRPKSLPKETKSVTAANPEKQRLTRSSKRWNAHMNSGEIVFSRSPPAVKSPEELSSQMNQVGGGSPANRFSFTESPSQSPAEKDVVKSLQSEFASHEAVTPHKSSHRMAECRYPTRSSPRLLKEKFTKVLTNPSPATPPIDQSKIWVPASKDVKTVALATISVDKSTGKSSLLIQSSESSTKTASSKPIEIPIIQNPSKVNASSSYAFITSPPADVLGRKRSLAQLGVRMEIMYPDGSTSSSTFSSASRPDRGRRLLRCITPNKKTAMSQDLCFREMQEFTKKNMLATGTPTNSASQGIRFGTGSLASPNANPLKVKKDTPKVQKKVVKKDENPQKVNVPEPEKNETKERAKLQQNKGDEEAVNEENGIESEASSPEEVNNALVRRSSRFESSPMTGKPPTTGKLLVRRSRKYLHTRRNDNPCKNCKARRRRCPHYVCVPVKKKKGNTTSGNAAKQVTGMESSATASQLPVKQCNVKRRSTRTWPKQFVKFHRKKDMMGKYVNNTGRKKELGERLKSLRGAETLQKGNNQMKDEDTCGLNKNGDKHGVPAGLKLVQGSKPVQDWRSIKVKYRPNTNTKTELVSDEAAQQPSNESTCQNEMESSSGVEVEGKLTEQACEPGIESDGIKQEDGNQSVVEINKDIAAASGQLSQCEQSDKEAIDKNDLPNADITGDKVQESKEPHTECQLSPKSSSGEVDRSEHQQSVGHQTPTKCTREVTEQAEMASPQSEISSTLDELQNGYGTDTTESIGQSSSTQSTPSSSPNSKIRHPCRKKHRHTPKCIKKHVHYPVCESPHLHGPRARLRRGEEKKEKRTPVHIHKPKCLAPHLHGPLPADGKRTPKKVRAEEKAHEEMVENVANEEETTKVEKNEVSQASETMGDEQ